MKHRILTAVVVIPLFITLSTTPAYAILGSILAGIQRAQMIVNQGVQIYKDTMAKITFDGQLTEMIDQASHLKQQALGTVGALTDPFTELASAPTQFIGLGLSWKNDFTGIAQGIASNVADMGDSGKSFRESWKERLTAADTVSETDFLNLFENSSPEIAARASRGFLAAREEGDKRLVLGHTMSDTASNLMVAAKDAVESYKGLQDNTNVSNTALAQSQIAGTVTQGNLTAAMAQLMAYYAAKEAAETYEAEINRRAALSNRVARNQQGEIVYDAHIAGIIASGKQCAKGCSFLFPVNNPLVVHANPTRSRHPHPAYRRADEGLQIVPRYRPRITHGVGGRGDIHLGKSNARRSCPHRLGHEWIEDRLWRRFAAVGSGAGRHWDLDTVGDLAVLHDQHSGHGSRLPTHDRGGRQLAQLTTR